MLDMSHLQLILTALGITLSAGLGVCLTFWKLLDSRLTRTDDIILNLSKTVAEASGKNITIQSCVDNNKAQDIKLGNALARFDANLTNVKEEVLGEVEAVETRLTKRIEKLEDKK